MQQLNLEISIPIPKDMVLIKKVELEELKKNSTQGVWWSMRDLEKRLNKKHEWIKENILYKPKFKNVLDVRKGGFVHYPESQGQVWTFQASKMTEFLEKNFSDIFAENRRYSRIG